MTAALRYGVFQADYANDVLGELEEPGSAAQADKTLLAALQRSRSGESPELPEAWLCIVVSLVLVVGNGHELPAALLYGEEAGDDEDDEDEIVVPLVRKFLAARRLRLHPVCVELLAAIGQPDSEIMQEHGGDWPELLTPIIQELQRLLALPPRPIPKSKKKARLKTKKLGRDGFYMYPPSPKPTQAGDVFVFEHNEVGVFWGRVVYPRAKMAAHDSNVAVLAEVCAVVTRTDLRVPPLSRDRPFREPVFVPVEMWTKGFVRSVGNVPFAEGEWSPRCYIQWGVDEYVDELAEPRDGPPSAGEPILDADSGTDPVNFRARCLTVEAMPSRQSSILRLDT